MKAALDPAQGELVDRYIRQVEAKIDAYQRRNGN
jgi:hypothetical protein